jgi:sialic acid synthase SpsE
MIRVICEAGLNWESFDESVLYAEKAKEIGADIIKYQWIKDDSLPDYKCHMNKGEWKALKGYCDIIGIEFMCTPSSEEIFDCIISMNVDKIKIGSDRAIQKNIWTYTEAIGCPMRYYGHLHLISNGYYETLDTNMYCVSLYPCDSKFIDFDKMLNNKYIGFSDHTLEYNKEWCDKIKACKNIQYIEKHFKLNDNCIDSNVSLNVEQMKEFIKNIKGDAVI